IMCWALIGGGVAPEWIIPARGVAARHGETIDGIACRSIGESLIWTHKATRIHPARKSCCSAPVCIESADAGPREERDCVCDDCRRYVAIGSTGGEVLALVTCRGCRRAGDRRYGQPRICVAVIYARSCGRIVVAEDIDRIFGHYCEAEW